jgi:hypothetical protein
MTDFMPKPLSEAYSRIPWEKLIEGADRIRTEEENASWAIDDFSFRKRFGISYDEFCEFINELSDRGRQRYDKIRGVDAEAAVLWVIERSTTSDSRE